VVKITIFGLTHLLKHHITRKLLNIYRYILQGVWQASNCLYIHATYCVIVARASPGETKMWAVVRENDDFFALAVRITGKLLQIDGYMLQGVWQASNFLSNHRTYYLIITEGKQKCRPRYVKTVIFTVRYICIAQTMPWQDVRLFYNLKRSVSCLRYNFVPVSIRNITSEFVSSVNIGIPTQSYFFRFYNINVLFIFNNSMCASPRDHTWLCVVIRIFTH